MRRALTALLALGILAFPAAAHADGAVITRVPGTGTTVIQCEPNVALEDILITSGVFQLVTQTVTTPTGTVIDSVRGTWQNLAGIGLTTGTEYHFAFVGGSMSVTGLGSDSTTATFAERVISAGPDVNELVTVVAHTTVTPDGTVTADVHFESLGCRG
jgi:hypothetical protein